MKELTQAQSKYAYLYDETIEKLKEGLVNCYNWVGRREKGGAVTEQ